MSGPKRIRYSKEAFQDLAGIRAYLRETAGARLAAKVLLSIREAILARRDNPLVGAPRPEFFPDARMIVRGRYCIYYRVVGDDVVVLRILHGSRNRPG